MTANPSEPLTDAALEDAKFVAYHEHPASLANRLLATIAADRREIMELQGGLLHFAQLAHDNTELRKAYASEIAALQSRLERAEKVMQKTSWVIERYIHSRLHYWTGRTDRDPKWHVDHMEALRLSRKTDAECMLSWHCDGVARVVEHAWVDIDFQPTGGGE